MVERRFTAAGVAVIIAGLVVCPTAATHGRSAVAGLQVALRRQHVYRGTIDGFLDRQTVRAVRRFQRRERLPADGVAGAQTMRALGRFARHRYGSRKLRTGDRGIDVATLQFALAWGGFPSGAFDGVFGPQTEGALRRFQASRRLPVSGLAGPRTRAALTRPPRNPRFLLACPLFAPVGDGFGPRGNRFHAGVDLIAPAGQPVEAAAPGRVAWAGRRNGFGLLVVLAHGGGIRTLYAHLSRIETRLGDQIAGGTLLGLVGQTGDATGPHLHFELRVDGAAVDPLPHFVVQP
jgi:murein DD-endopeptidase MepM/ murein hydrolase activator NlpD